MSTHRLPALERFPSFSKNEAAPLSEAALHPGHPHNLCWVLFTGA
jgi:hypothetical protein